MVGESLTPHRNFIRTLLSNPTGRSRAKQKQAILSVFYNTTNFPFRKLIDIPI